MHVPPPAIAPASAWIVAAPGSVLAAALQASLRHWGWPVERGEVPMPGSVWVVLVEHDDGRAYTPLPRLISTDLRACIGSVRSLDRMIPLVRRGAVPLNQDASLPDLAGAVLDALRRPAAQGSEQCKRRVVAIGRRRDEAAALARLTPSEVRVLDLLVAGFTAGRIAEHTRRSEHTVRSQVRSVLAKLDVSSQLVAVALAHRARYPPPEARQFFTNFGEETTPKGDQE